MENKIEVGEYVRTNKGRIGKVAEIRLGFNKDLQVYQDIYILDNGLWTILDYIVKHSKQLMELIKNKDILKLRTSDSKEVFFIGVDEDTSDVKYEEIITNIKNGENELLEILTSQQFEADCYKVGGEDE